MRDVRVVADRASTVALGLALLLLGGLLFAGLDGVRPLVIRSGSMTPTIGVGDVVLSRSVPAVSIRAGQVVTFHDPSRHGELVTHRVRAVSYTPSQVDVETRGDANQVSEKWSVPIGGSVGREVFVVPKVGLVVPFAQSPWTRMAVVVLVCGCLGSVLLRKIWAEA
ncbi:signal peptidase I [Spongisporangium articulatum]|uniref:Signal peptidase I n=1 Tax=Spongisporangium articulatum TaxID=3362603 RepID=A0ABW8APB4_9ACTN